MDTQTSEINVAPDSESVPKSSSPSASPQSFFSSSPRSSQPQIQLSLDPATFLLLTAILNELKVQNDINIARLQIEAQEKQEALEAAKIAATEDAKRFEEIRPSLYI